MLRMLSTAASGMSAQELSIDVISNNIANINTTAYQRQRAEFQDLLYQQIRAAGPGSSSDTAVVPTGIQVGLGVKTGSVYRIPEQGEFIQTSSDLDIAIRGKGYFQVTMPDGSTGYTRDGSLQRNASGEIVNSKGYIVQPGISIPENSLSVTINDSGQVYITVAGTVQPQLLGQFTLADFVNQAGLEAIGDNMYLETAASGPAVSGVPGEVQFGTLLQGWLETSNVNPVTEIADLIAAQRAYELNSKIIQAGDEMLQSVNQTV